MQLIRRLTGSSIKFMRIQIKSTGFELTPALQQLIEEKFRGFEKFLANWDKNDSVILRIEISKNTKHHQKGKIFYAEANLDLPKNVLRVEETNEDMHSAIDRLKDRLKNDLLRLKERAADH